MWFFIRPITCGPDSHHAFACAVASGTEPHRLEREQRTKALDDPAHVGEEHDRLAALATALTQGTSPSFNHH
ncbi:hypothetical protein GCM10009548_74210 [Streptomyces malaysiensis subsp. malaysiensis]